MKNIKFVIALLLLFANTAYATSFSGLTTLDLDSAGTTGVPKYGTFTAHTGATGTAVHGLGTASTQAYTTGTWTPALVNGHATTGYQGTYIQVGKLVFAQALITITATADTTNIQITLPVAAASVTSTPGAGMFAYTNSGRSDSIMVVSNQSYFIIYNNSGTQAREVDYSGKSFYFTVVYQAQ